MKILLAEDTAELANVVRVLLEHQKYTVDVVDNGIDALEYASSCDYDAILMDILMPGMDGITVIGQLRAQGCKTPIMLVSAKGGLQDRVHGLDSGADDYLPKPFAATELLARVRALLRRNTPYMAEILTIGNLSLNCATYELSTPIASLRLANKEFQLMEFFIRNPKQVFSTDELMQRIWGWSSRAEINVVWTNISYLRRKLASLGANVEIRSIRGAGYCIEQIPS